MLHGGAISLCVLWCVTQEQMQLNRRLNLVDAERSKEHLTAAESLLDTVQADIERAGRPAVLLAKALRERALLRDDEGRSADAIPLYEQAVAILRSATPTPGPLLGLTLANLASARADCGDFEAGITLATEAMKTLRIGSPEFAMALYARGAALHGLGRHLEALHDLREALGVWEGASNPDYAQMALLKDAIAANLADLGYSTKAEAAQSESLALRTRAFGADSLAVAESLNNLGVLVAREKRYTESERSLEKAARILEQFGQPGYRHLIAVLQNLGTLYVTQAPRDTQYYAKAEQVYRRKLAVEEQVFGAGDIRISATLELLGEALYGEHAYQEAGRTYERGVALQVAAFGPADPRTQAALKRQSALTKKIRGPRN